MDKVIHVVFVDSASGEILFVSDMPVQQLPESFEAETSFALNGGNWKVVDAEPMTASEFRASGQLRLTIEKSETIMSDPGDLLFSLPTISNEMPFVQEGSTKLNRNVLEIHEDDWRQIDVLPDTVMETVFANLASIQDVYRQNSVSVGEGRAFTSIHVRAGLDCPFQDAPISASSVLAGFPDSVPCEGVSFYGIAGIVENSFAQKLSNGLILYGCAENDLLLSLSVGMNGFGGRPGDDRLNDLSRVLAGYDLVIVDWCGLHIYRENIEG